MPRILVVDDSPVDRRMVGGLLEKRPDWTIAFAEHGGKALEMIAASPPDLIVTDLMMPEVDGLQLVAAVKKTYPLVPVILITSKGNEEIAVKALKLGAASYSPKSALAQDLVETVQSVLAVSSEKRTSARLMRCMTGAQCSFVIRNDANLIPVLVGYLQEDAERMGICDEGERVRVGVALDEALVNALYHGNLEVRSELRDTDGKAYAALVRQRASQPPYCVRQIYVTVTMTATEATITIRDEGPGFDPSRLPDPTDPANLEQLGGRGVLLMRTFMDEVTYNESGNQVTMIKRAARAASDTTESENR
jgi:CheY-like chemotaxis protein/anti-sigma regulatory factor (Ser/Thr protein kinase)